MNYEYEKLHIFTKNGRTFTFLKVTFTASNETAMVFTYLAQSDGEKKVGTFFVRNIAGFSTTERLAR